MDVYSALKVVSLVATGVFGVIGALGDDKEGEGKKKKRKKIAIVGIISSAALSLVLYEMEAFQAAEGANEARNRYKETKLKLETALIETNHVMSLQRTSLEKSQALENELTTAAMKLEMINKASREMASRQAVTLKKQTDVLAAEDHLRLWQLRGYFPLEPLTLKWEHEFPMDAPQFTRYVSRIWEDIKGGHINFLSQGRLAPNSNDGDDIFPDLTVDMTVFILTKGRSSTPPLSLDCFHGFAIPNDATKAPMPSTTLWVDVKRRVFILKTECSHPRRWGDDLAFSSIDLIGRTLTWETQTSTKGSIRRVEFVFPYDSNKQLWGEETGRYIVIKEGQKEVTITPDDVGLTRVFSETAIPRP